MASTPEGRRLTEAHRQAQQDVRDDFLAEFIALWVLLDSARLDETGPAWVQAVLRVIREYRQLSAEVATEYFADFVALEAPSSTAPPRIPDLSRPETAPPPAGPRTGRPPRRATPTDSNSTRRGRDGRMTQGERRRAERVLDRALEGSGVRFEIDERAFDLGERPRTRIEIPDIDWTPRDRAVEVSLNVTGPIGQKSKVGRGKPLSVARNESFVEAAGAASRHVLDGGNRSALKLIADDDRLVGYIRVTDGDPCSFCAMLASRGPVYRTPRRAGPNVRGDRNARAGLAFTGDGAWKVHDNCACTVEPVFTSNTQWPGRAQEFHNLWNEHIKGKYSGEDALRAWRRLYEQRQRDARRSRVA